MELTQLFERLRNTNLCSYFILPLIGVNELRFGGEANFLNSFLSKDGSLIYVEVYQPEFVIGTNLPKHRLGTDLEGRTYLEFKIPEKFSNDVALFMAGKYSEFSNTSKRMIREGSNLEYKKLKDEVYTTDVRLLALDKSPALKEFWEGHFYDHAHQSHISDDMELLSKPDEGSYLQESLTFT